MQIVRTEKEFEKRMNKYTKSDEFKTGVKELKVLAKAFAARKKKEKEAKSKQPVQEQLFI